MTKMTARQLEDKLSEFGVRADVIKYKGKLTARQGFFYRNGGSSQSFADKISLVFVKSNSPLKVTDHGEFNAPFKGGAPLAKQSHWRAVIE